MASNTSIAALPGGRVSVIIFDQPIDVLLISFWSIWELRPLVYQQAYHSIILKPSIWSHFLHVPYLVLERLAIGEGTKTVQRTIEGMKTLWKIFKYCGDFLLLSQWCVILLVRGLDLRIWYLWLFLIFNYCRMIRPSIK